MIDRKTNQYLYANFLPVLALGGLPCLFLFIHYWALGTISSIIAIYCVFKNDFVKKHNLNIYVLLLPLFLAIALSLVSFFNPKLDFFVKFVWLLITLTTHLFYVAILGKRMQL